jgi:broad specificity phosphatase PhoE
MTHAHFITHPEVAIDPAIPIPDWPLSPLGRARMHQALQQSWTHPVRAIFTSAERKARDAAEILSEARALPITIIPDLGENDRSATGYLPRAVFEAHADEFFAKPHTSVRGWEPAIDAQRRIIAATEAALAQSPPTGDIAIISHGGVGALLLCHLMNVPISRTHDQPGEGGGNRFVFDRTTRSLIQGWTRL